MAGRAAPCPEGQPLNAPPPVSRLVINSRLPVCHLHGLDKPNRGLRNDSALLIAAAVPTAAPAIQLPPVAVPAPTTPPDLDLISLADQLIAAATESRRLNQIVDRMDGLRWGIDSPAGMEIRSGDAALGIPQPDQTGEFIRRGFYDETAVARLRRPKWIDQDASTSCEHENQHVVTIRYVTPSTEARARADEIVAAFDEWEVEKEKKPRGYRAAKRAYDKAERLETSLEQKIQAIQATTIEGMIAKARCAELYYFESGVAGCFLESIAKDLLALGEASPTIAPVHTEPPPKVGSSKHRD
jgi:hypothetical protein